MTSNDEQEAQKKKKKKLSKIITRPPRSLTYIQHELETKTAKQIQTNTLTVPCGSRGNLG